MIKRLCAFILKWSKHDTDCAIHAGEGCTCGFFEETEALAQELCAALPADKKFVGGRAIRQALGLGVDDGL